MTAAAPTSTTLTLASAVALVVALRVAPFAPAATLSLVVGVALVVVLVRAHVAALLTPRIVVRGGIVASRPPAPALAPALAFAPAAALALAAPLGWARLIVIRGAPPHSSKLVQLILTTRSLLLVRAHRLQCERGSAGRLLSLPPHLVM